MNDECCPKLLGQQKHAMQRNLWITGSVIGCNLSSVRCAMSGTLGNRKQEYLKDKINEQKTDTEDKSIGALYGGISDLKC